jgi:hypothetical protein
MLNYYPTYNIYSDRANSSLVKINIEVKSKKTYIEFLFNHNTQGQFILTFYKEVAAKFGLTLSDEGYTKLKTNTNNLKKDLPNIMNYLHEKRLVSNEARSTKVKDIFVDLNLPLSNDEELPTAPTFGMRCGGM